MGSRPILVSLYDMASYDMPGVVLPTMNEVVAEIRRAGFECVPQSTFGPAEGMPSNSFSCSAVSVDVFDLLSVLIPSNVVFTAIARVPGSLSVYIGAYGGEPIEILGVPVALLDTVISKAKGLAVLEAWVKTQPYTDSGPLSSLSPASVVNFVHDAWAGTLNTDKFATTAEERNRLTAEFPEDWTEWIRTRRDPPRRTTRSLPTSD